MPHFKVKENHWLDDLIGQPASKLGLGMVARVRGLRETATADKVAEMNAMLAYGNGIGALPSLSLLVSLDRPNRGELFEAMGFVIVKIYGEGDAFAV